MSSSHSAGSLREHFVGSLREQPSTLSALCESTALGESVTFGRTSSTLQSSSNNDEEICPICYENIVQVKRLFCKHTLCNICYEKLQSATCPMCREPIPSKMDCLIPPTSPVTRSASGRRSVDFSPVRWRRRHPRRRRRRRGPRLNSMERGDTVGDPVRSSSQVKSQLETKQATQEEKKKSWNDNYCKKKKTKRHNNRKKNKHYFNRNK